MLAREREGCGHERFRGNGGNGGKVKAVGRTGDGLWILLDILVLDVLHVQIGFRQADSDTDDTDVDTDIDVDTA